MLLICEGTTEDGGEIRFGLGFDEPMTFKRLAEAIERFCDHRGDNINFRSIYTQKEKKVVSRRRG